MILGFFFAEFDRHIEFYLYPIIGDWEGWVA